MENDKNLSCQTEINKTTFLMEAGDETKQLWEIYNKKKQKKDKKKAIFLSIVFFFLILLVFAGLYIILSTTDPTHSK
ncbi:hypothetical protein ACWNT8_13490 [Pigmentibacter ruber]|uniref:hypothetical protein n=1 Tax=Pigmentibacter ruber TaxID=2683196 RepID=UPI00131E2FF5|nr:hypothetical protein [Pigmentibacter ruber]